MVSGESLEGGYLPGWRFYAIFAAVLITSLPAGIYAASRFGWEEIAWSTALLWLSAVLVGGFVVPDLAQYIALRRFGARPLRKTWIERGKDPLFVWWEAPDHEFSRGQFAVSHGFPVLISSVTMLAYAVRFPTAAPILAFVLPFYLGTLWYVLLVLRRPGGTLVKPIGRGIRFYEPAGNGP